MLNSFLVLVQGWSCFSPHFKAVDFVSFYIELPLMLIMYGVWKLVKRTKFVKLEEMDLVTDVYIADPEKDVEEGGLWKRIVRWVF